VTQDGHNAINSADNPFWCYSLSIYGQNNCAAFLLHAQNTHELDINVLLFIGWLAQQKKQFVITPQHKPLIKHFQDDVTKRIRSLRIKAKSFNQPRLYQAMLELELDAEYFEQVRLFGLLDHMHDIDLSFADIVKRSIEDYMVFERGKKGFEGSDNWLQTLIQYLQPVS
jgi:uncharacterized protein (TIGR02444 family)